ncbi:MAG: DmsC/YnfH family molybdoenzyme membrane anchor subunit, partial [Pseudomonadota bacterium]|nr:DmsC/YnfH family molybdoenzyme membrane anchor subunit [Pseudomonadota bacterium]
MHPAFSVIFLTTLIGAGQGLFLALFTSQVYYAVGLLPQMESGAFYSYGSALALLLLMVGLFASFFHLGHPERAWRSAARWRTSWLSREVIALPAFMVTVTLWGGLHYFGVNPTLMQLGGRLTVDLTLLVGAVATGLAFLLFVCTGMIYAAIRFLQEWASPLTVINFTLLGGASGFTIATAWAARSGSSLTGLYASWAVVLTLLALIFRLAALWRNARLKQKSTVQSAIGVRHPEIAQQAQGAMGDSFNTREFFHHRSAGLLQAVRWFFLVFVFVLPLVLLAVGASPASFGLLA